MSFFEKALYVTPARLLFPILPARELTKLPETGLGKSREFELGRCVRDGSQRAANLEFGTLYRDIFRDPLYRKARKAATGRSVIQEYRRMNLFLLLKFFMHELPSKDIIELGVWKGGTSFFLAYILNALYPGSRVYALDTFEGMPKTVSGLDLHQKGDFGDTNLQEVRSAAQERGIRNIEFVKGDVRETVGGMRGPFGLMHIDLDIYEPIKVAQTVLLPRIVPGGYLVYDDATVSSCPGATLAVEELVQSGMHSEQIFPHFVFRAPVGHASSPINL